MKNSLAVLVALVVALTVAGWFWFGDSTVELTTIDPGSETSTPEGTEELTAVDASGNKSAGAVPVVRRVVHGNGSDESDDPYYQMSLAGFRGRLVFEDKTPAPDKPIQLIRIDAEVLDFPDLFAQELMKPQLEIYETRSGQDGTFEISGVFPQVFYLMIADRGGDNQLIRVVEKTPAPGEVVDLGDLQMPSLGTLIGHVVDEDGAPVPAAMVRAADVPGTALDFVPLERFDPKGGLIISESNGKLAIIMPPYVQTAFDLLPIPNTRTDSKGYFILRGVQPGTNVVVINKRGLVPLLKKGVKIKPGKEKDVGKLRMREGEIVEGVVVDMDDKPIVGVEVLVASKNAMMPAHFGSFADKTDSQGRFSMSGMAAGQVMVAVRRSLGDSWIVHGPSPVAGDVLIKLKSRHTVVLKVKGATDDELEDVKIKLVSVASGGPPGITLGTLGMVPWISLENRLSKTEDGRFQIVDLDPGPYTIAVRAKGFAAASSSFKLSGDLEHEIQLEPALSVEVLVIDDQSTPIRNAKIYMSSQGGGGEMPVLAGKTDSDGKVLIEDGGKGELRVSASHPAFGTYHGRAQLPTNKPIVLRVQPAGSVTGILLASGKTPPPGKYTLTLETRDYSNRGALDGMPRLAMPNLRGEFEIKGLRPGKYRIRAIPSLAVINSPGGIMKMASASFTINSSTEVDVPSGSSVHVELDATGQPTVTGPSARVTGTVMINGHPAKNMAITGWGTGRRIMGEVDNAGRFDLGQLKVGTFNLRLVRTQNTSLEGNQALDGQLWSHSGKIEEGKDLQFDVTLDTGSISGFVTTADGLPAAGVQVSATGRTLALRDRPKEKSSCNLSTATDSAGRFTFPTVPAGVYSISVRGKAGHAVVKKQTVKAALPLIDVNLKLERVYTVSGKLDMSVFPKATGHRQIYVYLSGGRSNSGSDVADDGSFTWEGVAKGKYSVAVYCWGQNIDRKYQNGKLKAKIEITGDTTDLLIRPEFK